MPRPEQMIALRADRCTGCRLCELACVEEHYGPVPGHDISHALVFERRRLAIRATAIGVLTPQDRHEPSPVPDSERRTQETSKPSRTPVRDGDWRLETCDHCAPHPCVGACPHLALLRWPGGAVSLVEPRCTGCGACIAVCDRHAIRRVNVLDKAIKCDGCGGREQPPACVRVCPEDALELQGLPRLTAPLPGP